MEGKTRNEKGRGSVAITVTLRSGHHVRRYAMFLTFRLSQFPQDRYHLRRLLPTSPFVRIYLIAAS